MNFRLLTSLLLGMMLFSIVSGAQTLTVKGRVIDTLNSNNLPNASVMLIHADDSVMETFTRSKPDGTFELHPGTKDKYILMITFPSFADYLDEINLETKDMADLGPIVMLSRENLLSEFVLHANKGAIRIKGDTIEYIADSFKMKDGASVEDMLKRLPGLQVNKNGEITAQGEKVQKVLVDGEEFFSDDPAVVTRNLQADAIDKVQVFDKKSEQAEFTGIDDGQTIKTINLELKEDKKKGIFGKLEAGGGPGSGEKGGMFQNQGMVNQFKGKRQISAFGIMANTGKVGLGWEDRNKFGSGNNISMNDDGEMVQYFTNDDDDEFQSWNGQYNGRGLPKVWTGGVHFANKWQRDTNHVSANYRLAKQNMATQGNTVTQYVLPGAGLNKYEENRSFSTGLRHAVDGMYERKIDSLSSIKLTVDGGYSRTKTNSDYSVDNLSSEINPLTGFADTISKTDRYTFTDVQSRKQRAELTYRKKFMKKGRSLFISLNEQTRQSESQDTTKSIISAATDILQDQKRENTSDKFTVAGNINYTEPLSKTLFVELNYGLNLNNSDIVRSTYSYDALGNKTLSSDLSTNYTYDILAHTGGTSLKFVDKKITASLGGSVANASFKQTDNRTDTLPKYNLDYDRLNFFPRAMFRYKIGQQSSVRLNYSGSTNQPTIDQIQPIRNNLDPLNIAIGNPNLKQEFRHSLSGQYNEYKVLSGRYIWASANFSTTQDNITRVDSIAANGVRTYSYQNIDGNYSGGGYIGYGKSIQKWNLDIGGSLSTGIAHSNTIVNGQKNVSDNNNYGVGVHFRYDKRDKFSFSYQPGFNYNSNKATISTNTTSYYSWTHNLEAEVQLPLKFEVSTEVEWFIRQKTPIFPTNNNVLQWNASVSKKFLKKDQLVLKAYVFDILNQNKGFQRYASGNLITEDRYNTITQYGMLSLIWNFSRMAAGDKKPQGEEVETIQIN